MEPLLNVTCNELSVINYIPYHPDAKRFIIPDNPDLSKFETVHMCRHCGLRVQDCNGFAQVRCKEI